VEWLRHGTMQAVLDDRIMAEYTEVLARPVFRLPSAEVELVLTAIRDHAFWPTVAVVDQAMGLPDPDDAAFLECARAGGVALVTGNVRHFPKLAANDVDVMTPAQFVASIRS
jgi:predicted nucleic acid-binding protein